MGVRRFAAIATVLVGLLAAPLPQAATADPGSPAQLRKLTKQAAQLNKLFRGQIEFLEDARIQAKKATENADKLRGQLGAARSEVATIAQSTYMGGPLDGTQLLAIADPAMLLGQAANMQYMSDERTSRVKRIEQLIKSAGTAKKAADAKIKELEKKIKEMRDKRRDVEKLLAKYGFQTPTGGAGLTQRMTSVKIEVMQNFPMPYGVGCLRPGDPGEHGKGRACDFMISRGYASGADADRGDALAEFLIKNGSRLGVMYIIWKQRYYDIRSGGGWDPMSDRGSVTANHYDHVHVSVF
ncbi:coiled-coil domain-containing protein [Nonomuraea sp. NPDC050394]|uniref:coiled-coil domain-containing protein n=1 Tax=Nonomuraea sp. NPDC050394 TaxID=3364363 RepID=UPI00379EF634